MTEQKNINVLENYISKPESLSAERVGRQFFLDNHSPLIPNEGNLLSLMTLKEFYDTADPKDVAAKTAFKAVGKHESKYLVEAMKILSNEAPDMGTDEGKATFKLQQKFGRDFNAALGLTNLLKTKAEEIEFNKYITAVIPPDVLNHAARNFI